MNKTTFLIFMLASSVMGIELIQINLIETNITEIETSQIEMNDISINEISINEIELTDLTNNIEIYTDFMFKPRLNFGDYTQDWANTLSDYREIELIEYIPIDPNMRMIAEITPPSDREEFQAVFTKLADYKEQGYNSILLAFDGTEEVYLLKHFAKRLNDFGFDVYLAFGGYEESTLNLPQPSKYIKFLQTLAPVCKGFLLNWRQTCSHTFYVTDEWNNFNMQVLRDANPNIIILGEVYYGHNINSNSSYSLIWNAPTNISGLIAVNFGYDNINIEGVMTKYLPKQIGKDIPLIGVTINGDKSTIEQRFFNLGNGVITLSDTAFGRSSINSK